MSTEGFLHNHPDFPELIRIVSDAKDIAPALIEKDYWIMHCLFGLQKLGLTFQLKGGTSLSKGYCIIDRFSEDIDIRIEPPSSMGVKTGRNHDKPEHCLSRKGFYDWLSGTIKIDGIYEAQRDTTFDDVKYRSGGLRLHYKSIIGSYEGLKDGILLEVGFDDISPNENRNISSWAYDYAVGRVPIIDNRALDVACYHPGYTLVEKLQAISTKYRLQQETGSFPANFMRHYYDVYSLLQMADVQHFIGTSAYQMHKVKRFRSADNQDISKNDALLLRDSATRALYKAAYQAGRTLYYKQQPEFEDILAIISKFASSL
jgi:hypothetical protein